MTRAGAAKNDPSLIEEAVLSGVCAIGNVVGARGRASAAMSMGVLKNGLGSLRNLHGLLASVRVGPRDLTSAVVNLRDDCDLLRGALRDVLPHLAEKGFSERCCGQLEKFVHETLDELGRALKPLVNLSRLSVSQRLRLEPVVLSAVDSLGAVLPLLDDLSLGSGARLRAPGLAELIHEPGCWETEPALGYFQPVYLHILSSLQGVDLGVDVRTARNLVSLGLSLVRCEDTDVPGSRTNSETTEKTSILAVNQGNDRGVLTTIVGNNPSASGCPVPWRTYTCIAPTELCGGELSQLSGVKFQYQRSARRVEILWPGAAGPLPTASFLG